MDYFTDMNNSVEKIVELIYKEADKLYTKYRLREDIDIISLEEELYNKVGRKM